MARYRQTLLTLCLCLLVGALAAGYYLWQHSPLLPVR